MTVPRPAAPALLPVLPVSSTASFLPHPALTESCLPARPPTSLQLFFSRVAQWNPNFPGRTGSRRWEEGDAQALQAPVALLMMYLLLSALRTRQPPLDFQPRTHTSLSWFMEWGGLRSVFPTKRLPWQSTQLAARLPYIGVCSAFGDRGEAENSLGQSWNLEFTVGPEQVSAQPQSTNPSPSRLGSVCSGLWKAAAYALLEEPSQTSRAWVNDRIKSGELCKVLLQLTAVMQWCSLEQLLHRFVQELQSQGPNFGQRERPQAALSALREETEGKKCRFLFKILCSLGSILIV